VRELPELLQGVAGSPVALAFKYHQHPYRVSLALTRHDDHPVLAAVAEQAELATVLSRQGGLLTRATYLIKANKKQFLEVILPEGATLWSCLVSGRSVKPVEGTKKQLLVPLDATTDRVEAVSVELVYFERRPELVRIGQLQLQGPVLDVPTTVANWSVYAPHEITFLHMAGNLERGATDAEFLEDPFTPVRLAGLAGNRSVFDAFIGRKDKVGRLRADQRDNSGAVAQSSSPANSIVEPSMERAAAKRAMPQMEEKEDYAAAVESLARRYQDTGILPLKIRLPRSGTAHRFNRLMTTQEALTLNLTFVHIPLPQVPLAAFGLVLLPVAGLAVRRLRRA